MLSLKAAVNSRGWQKGKGLESMDASMHIFILFLGDFSKWWILCYWS